ncbi:unnamed protein product [Onchocerca flexuosa]|uniref:Reverse transcriptase n=1 Tax=Onchocerca flexuosa TaxID=387005 RepID=A0A183HRS7_9BILA|nr:unnamed protein product [Onchocerca flexuosa]
MTSLKKTAKKLKRSDIDSDNNDSTIKWEQFNSSELNVQNCRKTILDKFENLANQLAAGWKYHISNTDGIKEAWISFEDFYTEICLLATDRELFSVDGEIKHYHRNNNSGLIPKYRTVNDEYRTSEECDELLTEKVDALASKLSPNWTAVVTNISNTSKAWNEFKRYFQEICVRDDDNC